MDQSDVSGESHIQTHAKKEPQAPDQSPSIPPKYTRVSPSQILLRPPQASVSVLPLRSAPSPQTESEQSHNYSHSFRHLKASAISHIMPKANANPLLPLNGLFPIAKPSGPPSMRLIESITPLLLDSKLFYDPEKIKPQPGRRKGKANTTHLGLKIGQGGTLDPLADGVLVMGVNRGTKHLQQFLECTKEYESWGILGAATTTYDAEGPVISTHNFDGITRKDIEKAIEQFNGTIKQTPPIFSALKMDGKPLYEYARESIPLPRPIPVRECKVTVELVDYKPASVEAGDGGHEWKWPAERLSEDEKGVFRRLTAMVEKVGTESKQGAAPDSLVHASASALTEPDHPETSAQTGLRPAAFKVRMTVSSGTYVRSIVHDIGLALGCGAHVVTLTRTRQGQFVLHGDEEKLAESKKETMGRWYGQFPRDDKEYKASEEVNVKETEQNKENGEELDPEEAAMNAATANTPPTSLPISAIPDQIPLSVNHSNSTPKPSAHPTTAGAVDYSSSTVCIPWSVWANALQDRETMLANEKREREEAFANSSAESGLAPADLKRYFSDEMVKQRRRERPLQEWEEYVLARFEEVPVPIGGAHGTARFRQ